MNANFYGGEDPLELPVYTMADAARFLSIPPATVRAWTRGRSYPSNQGERYFEPLITSRGGRLSFLNLVELHVLRALREVHEVKVESVRNALDYAERSYNIKRLLLNEELLAGGGNLFLDHYQQLVSISQHGQIAIRELLKRYLSRIDRNDARTPIRLYPMVTGLSDDRPVVIDPRISFGRPTLRGTGIRTNMITYRVDAGESIDEIAEDYGIERELVTEAVIYEKAA